jgi:hypothetical protein
MKQRTTVILYSLVIIFAAAFFAPVSEATEGAVGRPIPGMQITPYAGIVPPMPGWLFSMYFNGSISGNKQIPIAGELAVGLNGKVSLTTFTAIHVWNTKPGKWNFLSAVTLPIIYTKVDADVSLGTQTAHQSDSVFSLWDLPFVPISAGYHFSQVEHMSFALTVFAPTASYTKGKLANAGLNVWTVSPGVSYTKIFPEQSFEFSGNAAVDFSSENPDTDYKNAPLLHIDVLGLKRWKNGWGVGGIWGWVQQLGDDDGTLATVLDGFVGHSVGVGPMVTYSRKMDKCQFDLNIRFVPEFATEKRLEGNPFMVSTTFQF